LNRRELLTDIGVVGLAISMGAFIGIPLAEASDGGSNPKKPVHPRLKKTKIPWKEKFSPDKNLKDLLGSLDLDHTKRDVVVSAMTYTLREVGYEMVAVEGIEEKMAFRVIGGVLARFHKNTVPAIKKAFEKEKKKEKSGVLEESGVEGF
jgi:hypothetical protein